MSQTMKLRQLKRTNQNQLKLVFFLATHVVGTDVLHTVEENKKLNYLVKEGKTDFCSLPPCLWCVSFTHQSDITIIIVLQILVVPKWTEKRLFPCVLTSYQLPLLHGWVLLGGVVMAGMDFLSLIFYFYFIRLNPDTFKRLIILFWLTYWLKTGESRVQKKLWTKLVLFLKTRARETFSEKSLSKLALDRNRHFY